ncbi:hypothetical protein PVK06_002085 [Gossypium arboreum]|uniref:Uncharacterized protein n=1 Tax=Gossypium arboreum TaxID=29729 RepID=A0ABR0R2U7_GOSAR|nr:hypothetical protein PVK06_002085 [Gossypium arboreum]
MKDIQKLTNSINTKHIRLVATIEDMDISKNLFYAYTRAYNNSIVAPLCQLSPTPIPKFPMFSPIIRGSVESPPIVHVSDVEKEKDSRDVEDCMRRIDSLIEGDIIVVQEVSTVEEEVTVEEEDICVEVVNKKAKEENNATTATEKESVQNIVNASEFVDANNDNLE